MKILYENGCTSLQQDKYGSEKNDILTSGFSLLRREDLVSRLKWWLFDRKFLEGVDYFNLLLWIPVMNKLDEALQLWIASIDFNMDGDVSSFNSIKSDILIILRWTSSFLRCSFNKHVYSSVDVSNHCFV